MSKNSDRIWEDLMAGNRGGRGAGGRGERFLVTSQFSIPNSQFSILRLRSVQVPNSQFPKPMTQLSETVKELIAKARIISFAEWDKSHSKAAIAIFQAADDAFRYLSDEDLLQIQTKSSDNSELIPVAVLLRDRAAEIVDEAREQVLTTYPEIIQPGGGLYPPERAQACWRDFWHFLRCITYGIAGGHAEYTNPTGLHYMNLLYQELQVPLDAMLLGLKSIKRTPQKR